MKKEEREGRRERRKEGRIFCDNAMVIATYSKYNSKYEISYPSLSVKLFTCKMLSPRRRDEEWTGERRGRRGGGGESKEESSSYH